MNRGGAALVGQIQQGGVEAFQMPHLQDGIVLAGDAVQLRRLFHGAGDGLLHQYMSTSLQEVPRHLIVQGGGHGDAHRVHLTEQLPVIGHPATVAVRRHPGDRLGVSIGHGDQIGVGKGGVLLGVKLAEIADADDGASGWSHGFSRVRFSRDFPGRCVWNGQSWGARIHRRGAPGRLAMHPCR